ncbi:MAG: VCBS repeat-containing protein, partial [Chitinispirillaceae bacterium]|nr:VCBS repeat-containing protein [Chitinispirillaceae bacterium]
VIVPSYDGWMYCYSAGGMEVWRVQFDAAGEPFVGAGEAVAGDLDNDGIPEAVFTTYSVSKDVSHLFVLNNRGALMHRVPIAGRGSMAAPTLADVDGDGVIEIVVSLKDALGGGVGGVQVWEVSSAKKSTIDWPTGRGNYMRTGDFSGF